MSLLIKIIIIKEPFTLVEYWNQEQFKMGLNGDLNIDLLGNEIISVQLGAQIHLKSQNSPFKYNDQILPEINVHFGVKIMLNDIGMIFEDMSQRLSEVPFSLLEHPEYQFEQLYGMTKSLWAKLQSIDLTPRQQIISEKIAEHLKFEEILENYNKSDSLITYQVPTVVSILSGPEKDHKRVVSKTLFTIGREGDDIPLSGSGIDIAHILIEVLQNNRFLVSKLNPKSMGKIDGKDFEFKVIDHQSKIVLGKTMIKLETEVSEEKSVSTDSKTSKLQFNDEVIELDFNIDEIKNLKLKKT